MIGEAHEVVKTRYIALEPLVNAEQSEEICCKGVGGDTALALPESGVKVVAFVDNAGALTGAESLG